MSIWPWVPLLETCNLPIDFLFYDFSHQNEASSCSSIAMGVFKNFYEVLSLTDYFFWVSVLLNELLGLLRLGEYLSAAFSMNAGSEFYFAIALESYKLAIS